MWLKLALLLIYVTVLFILARCLEVLTWHELGHLSQRFLDPMTLSVLKLKALLEQRGVSYEGVVEKSELKDLVNATGQLTGGELSELELATDEEDVGLTNFTCGSHFYEQVEDTKDSLWLIKVNADQRSSIFLSDSLWKSIRKKVNKFGVNAGIFDCSLDRRLCIRKGWNTSRLILALPQDFRTKSNVALHTYTGVMKLNFIYEWIRNTVENKVEEVSDFHSFESKWMMRKQSRLNPELRVIFFKSQDIMPLFFSALSVKFPGRVRFGSVRKFTESGKNISKNFPMKETPAYLVISTERAFVYGERVGEQLTFKSMEKFFRWFYPGVNDLFVASLVTINICSCFEFFLVQGLFFRRFWRFILCITKYNIILLLTWILLLGLFQVSTLETLALWVLKFIRYFSDTSFACYLRNDFLVLSSNSNIFVVCFSLLSFMFGVGIVEYKRTNGELRDEAESEIWNFAQFRTLEHLFRPTVSLARTRLGYSHGFFNTNYDHHFPSTPTLWLQSPVTHDYMRLLPVWKYSLPNINSLPGSASCCFHSKLDKVENFAMINQKDNLDLATCTGSECSQQSSTRKPSETNIELHNPSYQPMSADSLLDSNYCCECGTEQDCQHTDGKISSVSKEVFDTDVENGASKTKSHSQDGSCRDNMPDGFRYASQCVICLDSYQVGDLLCGLPCWHAFHKQCIMTWLTRDNHFCPICRWYSYKVKSEVHLHSE